MRRGLCVREQRTEALGLETKLFSVFHCERRQLLLVVIRGINATLHRGRNRQIVRFSEREHPPRIGSEIWLSTLEYYRKGENLHADQRDSMEGRLKLDAAPLLARSLTKSGVHAAVDLSGVVRTGREVANLRSSAGFTKPRSFSYQSEYRFALRTIGEPSNTTLRLPVSDALRALTSIHPCGALV